MGYNEEAFIKILKSKGLKVTNQRKAVLKALSSKPDQHLTAEEIYELVRVDTPEIGIATIYRTIQLLCELGLIDKLNLDDGYVRYEIGKEDKNEHHHHHLICKSCGKVWSFEDDLLEELESYIERKTDFHVLDHELKFYGQCKECAEKESAEKRK